MIAAVRGIPVIVEADKNEIRRYLLGQLKEDEQERVEMRLLTDPSFIEEFDTIVDEITDQYVDGELDPRERERVEQHFLQATERQRKVEFATAMREHSAALRGDKPAVVEPATNSTQQRTSSFRDRLFRFWQTQGLAYRFATIFVAVLILAGIVFLIRPGGLKSHNYALLDLTISRGDRTEGPETKSVKLTPETDALRITLQLPAEESQTKTFRVELADENNVKRNLEIAEQSSHSVTTLIPASFTSRGRYALHLFVIDAGTERRVSGSYLFRVE